MIAIISLRQCLTLNWRSAYHDLAENQARINLEYNLNATFDMLTGHGAHILPVTQATVGLQAYFNQVADLASKARKAFTPQGPSACFHNLVQQSEEFFTDFQSHVTEAVERRGNAGSTILYTKLWQL